MQLKYKYGFCLFNIIINVVIKLKYNKLNTVLYNDLYYN